MTVFTFSPTPPNGPINTRSINSDGRYSAKSNTRHFLFEIRISFLPAALTHTPPLSTLPRTSLPSPPPLRKRLLNCHPYPLPSTPNHPEMLALPLYFYCRPLVHPLPQREKKFFRDAL
ncbi:hypothetical protein CEXT_333991 [Caerostris extrusa]|uniref:Uncharacterized protein n=1 Tax=Caerostris extrusa TaxID=172846 RepID=A0AAV4XYP3_CAEEX|nr:hypothetical protein CEXT_333991 [Caerostris extrusa]